MVLGRCFNGEMDVFQLGVLENGIVVHWSLYFSNSKEELRGLQQS